MPRFTRRPNLPRKRANYGWSGTVATRTALSAGAQVNSVICDAASQLAVGLTPVLQRIRGSLVVDPDISAAHGSGDQFWTTFAAIWVGGPGTTPPDLSVAAGWGSEAILWAQLVGSESRNTAIEAGTDSELAFMYVQRHKIWQIDVRAKRQLEDPTSQVYLSVRAASSNTSQVQYSYAMRCLHRV